jgi:polyphenol oxidase
MLHGFSTRKRGVSKAYGGKSLNLGITEQDTREAVERNREIFLKELGATKGSRTWPMVPTQQIHSAIIHCVNRVPEKMLQGDGLITNVPGMLLTVRTADCVPVLVADGKQRAAGAFHAGWRGTLERIVEKGVGEMRRQFGSNPVDLIAAIGPCIHACCYEVSDDFPEKFRAQFEYADSLFEEVFDSNSLHLKYPMLFLNQRAPGHGDAASKLHLNLVEANRRQLLDGGLAEKNIWISDLCTSCRTDLLFSHRAEFGQTGRMLAAIGIRP